MIYFDYAASCPLDEEAAEVYIKASTEYYGNTKSLHDIGSKAGTLLEHCRQELARLLAVEEKGVYFTSGGSEGNFLSVRALLSSTEKKGKHIITSIAEHSSIQSVFQQLEDEGYETTYLPLDNEGFIHMDQLHASIREDTILICIQHGNSEIGTLQPILDISRICKKKDILFHSDCVHTFGKIDLKPIAQVVDSLSISSHKFYGPKGVGLIYIHPRHNWQPFFPGAVHEKGIRPGTINLPAIASMTVAASKAYNTLQQSHSHYRMLRKALIQHIALANQPILVYNADENKQIMSTIGMRIKGLEGQYVMLEANRLGFALATGSACSTDQLAPSKTMKAIGVPYKEAKEFFRISLGRSTTLKDIEELAAALLKITH